MRAIPLDLSVAIVDDERAVRTSLARLLRSYRIHVEVFASGIEFLERLHAGAWRVALVDIHMPGLAGFEILKRIRAERPGLAVIMITGYEGGNAQRRTYESGADGFLLKPFTLEDLLRAVQALPVRSAAAPA